MNIQAHNTIACPRLSTPAPRLTTAEMIALLSDTPDHKRNGTVRAVIVRHVSVKV